MQKEIIQDRLDNSRQIGEASQPETDEEGNPLPTEEEQVDYDLLVVRARKMMFGKGREGILELMGASESPAKGMGKAGAMILQALLAAAKESGREISPDVVPAAGEEIAEDLVALAEKNGVFQFESEEEKIQEMQDAMLWGVKFMGDAAQASGQITPEMQAAAKQQMQQGLAEEQGQQGQQPMMAAGPKQKPVAAAVRQGIVGGSMGGGA